VGAALLMTTARALLRQRLAMTGEIAQVLSDVNMELSKDVRDTGQFMTFFFLEIDPGARRLTWVRAGHDPAILYDPDETIFHELTGKGMALGVVQDIQFQQYSREGWSPGTVIVVGTDGIWETHNENREMFGPDRFRNVIRNHAGESAEAIQNRVIDALRAFRGAAPQEDDITLVVVKLL
jgi:sigma-B regulation protein RsbU (phosphoserine phosphatase)